MKRLVIYIHGKGGNAKEAEHYKTLFTDSDVIGFDYKSQYPWEAENEFPLFYDLNSRLYDSVILIANSIGAYFALSSLGDKKIDKVLLISPVVNMEKLINDMMMLSGVSEKELSEKKEIITDFGETLSWEYLCYARKHPIKWNIPTCILYGENDNLTSLETITEFARRINASLCIMKNGEHWFHTEKQMAFLDNWVESVI